jgi:pimeloyl-ACP methyl ester carboxylesterase
MRNAVIECAGLRLGASLSGNPSDPALLLLHGWPHSKEAYDQVIDELSPHHFVLAFDLPAIGDSHGLPRSAEKIELANILLTAAEQAGAHSMVIAGFDVGGMIAFAAARAHEKRIRGAVIMNTVVPGIEPWEETLADARIWHFAFHAIPRLPELLVGGHEREYFDYFANVLVGNKKAFTERHRDRFARAYSRPEALCAGFDWYRAMPTDAKHNRSHQKIEVPVLYLRGDAAGDSPEDYLPGLRAAGVANITGGVLPRCGEIAPLEAPEAFKQALLNFARTCNSDCKRPETRASA